MPSDVSGKQTVTCDLRESIANVIYCKMGGIKAHSLALKIYRSEGMTEYSDSDVDLIRMAVNRWCMPCVIDGLELQLKEKVEV